MAMTMAMLTEMIVVAGPRSARRRARDAGVRSQRGAGAAGHGAMHDYQVAVLFFAILRVVNSIRACVRLLLMCSPNP